MIRNVIQLWLKFLFIVLLFSTGCYKLQLAYWKFEGKKCPSANEEILNFLLIREIIIQNCLEQTTSVPPGFEFLSTVEEYCSYQADYPLINAMAVDFDEPNCYDSDEKLF